MLTFNVVNNMKLLRYNSKQDVPPRCAHMVSIPTLGNPFSDEKSASDRIERAVANGISPGRVAVCIVKESTLGTVGSILGAYIADV
jgi:hypothetical protein